MAFQLTAPALQAATDVPACGFAEIIGVVTAADTGLPLEDIEVEADGEKADEDVDTNASGSYSMTLPAYRDNGPYEVTFTPPRDSPYLTPPAVTTQAVSGTTTCEF